MQGNGPITDNNPISWLLRQVYHIRVEEHQLMRYSQVTVHETIVLEYFRICTANHHLCILPPESSYDVYT